MRVILFILGLIGIGVSFSIPGLIGFFTFLLGLVLAILGVIAIVRAKKKRSRSYSFR
ncbi:hypothetical protein [Listeria costaricensis]|uniref:hypothetical protein n=1 Tax=Listeria costaricensis TaxID=2026604 RepID=UPI001F08DCC8|nr:hypothetical protein [Listeria costaricensis]